MVREYSWGKEREITMRGLEPFACGGQVQSFDCGDGFLGVYTM